MVSQTRLGLKKRNLPVTSLTHLRSYSLIFSNSLPALSPARGGHSSSLGGHPRGLLLVHPGRGLEEGSIGPSPSKSSRKDLTLGLLRLITSDTHHERLSTLYTDCVFLCVTTYDRIVLKRIVVRLDWGVYHVRVRREASQEAEGGILEVDVL